MAQNKGAIVRYRAIDRCLRSKHGKYGTEELRAACADALYDAFSERMSVSRRQIYDDLNHMESNAGYRAEIEQKNLLKLYINDVGLLTSLLYGMNANAILEDIKSINLGTVYESAVAQELHAHGGPLFYYDNKKLGEVDFIIDDYSNLSVLPIEVKSGKDYYVHSALDKFISNKDYSVKDAIVLCNRREVKTDKNGVTYMPVYYSMFIQGNNNTNDMILPLPKMPV